MKKKILITLALLLYGIITFLCGNYISAKNFQIIAETDDIKTAGEIQDALSRYERPTIRFVDGAKYMIAIFGTNKKLADYTAVELVEKNIVTDDVRLNLNIDFGKLYKCPPKIKTKIEKSLENRLQHLEGVHSATVSTDIPNLMIDFRQTPKTHVTIITNKTNNLDKITKNTKVLIAASIPSMTKENIKVTFEYID